MTKVYKYTEDPYIFREDSRETLNNLSDKIASLLDTDIPLMTKASVGVQAYSIIGRCRILLNSNKITPACNYAFIWEDERRYALCKELVDTESCDNVEIAAVLIINSNIKAIVKDGVQDK